MKIAGVEMLKRVVAVAASVCAKVPDCEYLVATDDSRILDFCSANTIAATPTSGDCTSGTERCWDAIGRRNETPGLIVNLQGDNPLCPPHVIRSLIDAWKEREADVFTPCVHLSWPEYERLLESKKTTPYSGTTVLVDKEGYALAFSKTTIPAVRNVEKARKLMERSPVRRHVGLYAYTYAGLKGYIEAGPSCYEAGCVEGLEQMRFLENGMKIRVVPVDYRGRKTTGGVDSPEDIARVERIIAEYGELDLT